MKERLLRPTGLSHFFFWRISCVCVCVCVCRNTGLADLECVCVQEDSSVRFFLFWFFSVIFFNTQLFETCSVCVCTKTNSVPFFFYLYYQDVRVCRRTTLLKLVLCVFVQDDTSMRVFFYIFSMCALLIVCVCCRTTTLWEGLLAVWWRGRWYVESFFEFFFYVIYVSPRCMMTWLLVCGCSCGGWGIGERGGREGESVHVCVRCVLCACWPW